MLILIDYNDHINDIAYHRLWTIDYELHSSKPPHLIRLFCIRASCFAHFFIFVYCFSIILKNGPN